MPVLGGTRARRDICRRRGQGGFHRAAGHAVRRGPDPPAALLEVTLGQCLNERGDRDSRARPRIRLGIAFTLVAGRLFGGGDERRSVAAGLIAINELSRVW